MMLRHIASAVSAASVAASAASATTAASAVYATSTVISALVSPAAHIAFPEAMHRTF